MDALARVLGESPGMVAVREQVRRLLAHPGDGRRLPPLLIRGETGTGKGLLARALHAAGPRAAGPFVDLNCAAIPETLLEAELFGVERGAFTDARQSKPGLFQAAHQGMLFLDEVGHLPETLQAKLLTVIEDRTVRRLGSTRREPADAWILAATSVDLEAAMRERRFLEALYHRLSVVTVALPPLRERGADIVLLAETSLARCCADYGLPPKSLAPDARAALLTHSWPGNVRELGNVIERAALLSDATAITPAALGLPSPLMSEDSPAAPGNAALRDAVGRFERVRLVEALERSEWNVTRAADLLGVPRNTLRYRIAKYGLRPDDDGGARRVSPGPDPGRTSAPSPPAAAAGADEETRAITLLRVALSRPSESPDTPVGGVFESVADKIEAFGGRITTVGEEGVVAAFGLDALEEAPSRAAHAALAIRRLVERDLPGVLRQLRIALHAARLPVFRVPGVPPGITEATMADTLQTLASLITGNPGGAVAVSPSTALLLERRFELEAVGGAPGTPSPAYRLLGRERTGYGLGGRRLTPLVGRERELDAMADLLARTGDGRGQVLGIVGDPGVGKSRIIYEFTRPHRIPDWLVLQSAAMAHGAGMPYVPIVELLRGYFGLEDHAPAPAIDQKVSAALAALDGRLTDARAPLLHLLGALPTDDPFRSYDRRRRQRRSLDALRQVLVRESQRRPIVIVFDDVQWIDPESQAALDVLAESLPTTRILLVFSHRPEYQHGLGGRSYYTQLRVDPLSVDRATDLLRSLLGSDASLSALARRLVARSGGNPFFLEESARALVDAAVLAGEPGAYRLTAPADELDVPASIQAVLTSRFDRLPPSAKPVLQCASVIGPEVPFALLVAVVEEAEDTLRLELSRLRAAEFLYETALLPDVEYTFKHPLTHEVVYANLLPDRRRALHVRILDALERLHPERSSLTIARLAHHAWRGGAWARAAPYLHHTGLVASARSAHRDALASFEQALQALEKGPDVPDSKPRAIDILLDMREPLIALEQIDAAVECLRRAEALARSAEEGGRLARALTGLCQALRLAHDSDGAVRCGQQAMALAGQLGDAARRLEAAYRLGQAQVVRGDYVAATALLREVVEGLDTDRASPARESPGDSVAARTWLGIALANLGRFEEGIEHGEAAIRGAESDEHPHELIAAHAALGTVCLEKGDHFRAALLLERALVLARSWNIGHWSSGAAAGLAHAHVLDGRLSEAFAILSAPNSSDPSAATPVADSSRLRYLAHAHLVAGQATEALGEAEQALKTARARGERGQEAWILLLLGEIAAWHDPPDPAVAEARYRAALVLAEERGMRPLAARCHLGLGRLRQRTGDHARAADHLTTAAAMFREMDMRFWLDALARHD